MFQKGKSGNPLGRPKDEIAPLARAKCKKAFETLLSLLDSDDESIQLKASIAIIERGYGKPIQTIEGEGIAPQVINIIRPETNGHSLKNISGQIRLHNGAVPSNGISLGNGKEPLPDS